MTFSELLACRHSVRQYKDGSIAEGIINELIEKAKKSPSAGALRAYDIFIVKDRDMIGKLALIAQQPWISQVSLIFVLCINPEKSAEKYGERGRRFYCIQDATLFGAYLDLLFVEKGYGTCWIGSFNPEGVIDCLNIPEHLIPISFLVVGEKNE